MPAELEPAPRGPEALTGATIADARTWLGVVAIGRNEGDRLVRCLQSLRDVPRRVYVDSDSSDGSAQRAHREGIEVVQIEAPPPLTAARARNAGIAHLLARYPDLEFVQMIDGDCEIRPQWIDHALAALLAEPDLALVFGRRRERHPERSIYNALCDDEWNAPLGDSDGLGGDALFRVRALREVDCYIEGIICGEDLDLSMRLRKRGWRLKTINAEMTLHDADILRFGQWWRRTRRAGHGFAELAYRHPDARDPNWPRQVRSIAAWGGMMPMLLLISIGLALLVNAMWWLAALLLVLPWPVRMVQLTMRARRRGLVPRVARASGILLMVGKVPQFLGLLEFYWNRIVGRASHIIEYKGPKTSTG